MSQPFDLAKRVVGTTKSMAQDDTHRERIAVHGGSIAEMPEVAALRKRRSIAGSAEGPASG